MLISSELHLFWANYTYFKSTAPISSQFLFKLTVPSILIIQSFLSPPWNKIHLFQCNCESFKAVNFNGSSFMHLLQANYNYLKLTSPFQANVKCFKLIATMNHIFKRPAPFSRTSFKLTQWNSEILIRGRSARSDPQRNVAFHLLENEFENVELTHGTRLGMDGKALGWNLNFFKNYLNHVFLFSKFNSWLEKSTAIFFFEKGAVLREDWSKRSF